LLPKTTGGEKEPRIYRNDSIKELKRRSRIIGAFPNDASSLLLAGTSLVGIIEEWITSRRYLSEFDVIVCQDTRAEYIAT